MSTTSSTEIDMSKTQQHSEAQVVKSSHPSVPLTDLISALLQFTVSSVSMMIGNKMAVSALPLPCTLVIIQALGTLILLGFCRKHLQGFNLETVKEWFPIAFLFSLMLFTSLKSFVYVNVSTVLIFRNTGAILTTFVEWYVRGTAVNARIILSEISILGGAVMYGWFTVSFSWIGFFWIMFNVAGQVTYGVLLKHKMETAPQLKDMSKYTMSMYNNILALPMITAVLLVQGEQGEARGRLESVDGYGWVIIGVTCFCGFLISTSGFGLQKLVSATSFLVINNLTKFLNILLGMLFLNDKLSGALDATGCVVALLGGFWYSYEQMKLNEKAKKNASG